MVCPVGHLAATGAEGKRGEGLRAMPKLWTAQVLLNPEEAIPVMDFSIPKVGVMQVLRARGFSRTQDMSMTWTGWDLSHAQTLRSLAEDSKAGSGLLTKGNLVDCQKWKNVQNKGKERTSWKLGS